MGCFHFHVKDQLLEFARRMKRFRIDISVFDLDAIQLANEIERQRVALGPFDRVEVSNILDRSYVGIERTLKAWGPLLNPKNQHSVLIGSFINWVGDHPGAKAKDLPPNKAKPLMDKAIQRLSVSSFRRQLLWVALIGLHPA